MSQSEYYLDLRNLTEIEIQPVEICLTDKFTAIFISIRLRSSKSVSDWLISLNLCLKVIVITEIFFCGNPKRYTSAIKDLQSSKILISRFNDASRRTRSNIDFATAATEPFFS